jgi:Lamin Tail Domain/Bacterial Ig-like domain
MLFRSGWALFFVFFISTIAKAQVVDNFSDGDFTTNPVWSGDATEFIVNPSFQLQTNNTIAGASYLSTPSPTSSLNNIEWSFYIKQSFSPSSSNYGRVYLASDQTNLEGSLNGYYLQFGEALANDAVELFRQTGTTSTSVCRGTNTQIAASFAIGIRVTRDVAGFWSLYVDPAGGTAYGLEATGTDNTYTTTSYFGVATVYTSSNGHNFYFDNFYNGAIIIDITPPSMVSSTVISSTQLDVLFDEAVDLTTSQTLSNYSANNSLGNPTVATRDAVNFSLVHLTFATAFVNGLLNTLTVSNVQDLSANVIITATTNFTYTIAVTAVFKDIIINEIMADPTPQVNVPAVEFVEVYNRSSNTYNLNGWKFTDNVSTATLGNIVLSPNQYLIICNTADTALFITYGNHIGVSSFPSLNNSGDHLYLKDNTLAFIDSVTYSDTWYQDAVKKLGGWTLELINPNVNGSCPTSANWIASNDISGGTPGTQNSVYSTMADTTHPSITGVTVVDSTHIYVCFSEAVDASLISLGSNYNISSGVGTPALDTVNSTLTCAYLTLSNALITSSAYKITITNITDCSGNPLLTDTANFSFYKVKPFDVVINEIMADPDPVHNILPNNEYVELYNKTSFPISLNNWTFAAGTTIKTILNATIAPHGYIVLTDPIAVSFFFSNINIVGITSFPTLTNTGQTLTLKSPEGATISTVSYTDAWYTDTHKNGGGWSIEQIDPTNPCAGISNWRASVSPAGGTPGTINAVNAANPDHTPPLLIRVAVIAADTIQLYFNEPLDSTTMPNLAVYTINNSIGTPLNVKPIAPDFASVRLTLATAIQTGIIYTITVNNAITDCVGNAIELNNSARFALPQQALPNDIAINELLADPNTGGVDYVEIINRSNKVIDLKTITLSEFDTIANLTLNPKTITTEGYLMFPNDYLVLSANGNAVKSQYNTTNPEGFIDLPSMITMNIASGTVCLSTTTDIIDNFIYNTDMQFALLNVTKGVSLERIDFNRTTQDRTNWHSAAQDIGFGTPGNKNSQYNDAGQTDNTIEITPEIFSPDEDGYNDIVNINYHFDIPGFTANVTIYDSKGILAKHLIRNELLGTKGTFSWDGINDDREKCRIGIYIIYFQAFDLTGTVKHYKKTCVLGGKL